MAPGELERLIIELEEEMFAAAEELRFEYAAKLRDEIKELRRDFPHAFYDQVRFSVPIFTEGDVQRRMVVRREELFQSLGIIRQVLEKLPAGPIQTKIEEVPSDRVALGYVEGWRGEIFHWIHTAPGNRLARCKVKDPSLQNWPALSEAILGNIIPDFPVVNKSFNLSYSGTDR